MPEGPTSKCGWWQLSVGIGGRFFSSSPGAWRPRQSLCRPSGAGFLGKQGAVNDTHIGAREHRPWGAKMARGFVGTQGRNSGLQARRDGIAMRGAAATGGDRREFFPSSPGAWRPRQSLCRPSGAGFVGKQGVVYDTHIEERASRPCGSELDVDMG
jgi:hypothetical protein